MTVPQRLGGCPDDSAASTPADLPAEPLLVVSHAAMNSAYLSGDAVPLDQTVSWLVRYRDAWWVVYEDGWLRVTDGLTAADIDQAATRLAGSGPPAPGSGDSTTTQPEQEGGGPSCPPRHC